MKNLNYYNDFRKSLNESNLNLTFDKNKVEINNGFKDSMAECEKREAIIFTKVGSTYKVQVDYQCGSNWKEYSDSEFSKKIDSLDKQGAINVTQYIRGNTDATIECFFDLNKGDYQISLGKNDKIKPKKIKASLLKDLKTNLVSALKDL